MFLFVIPTAIFVPKAHRTVEFGYYIIHTHSQHWLGSCRVLHGLRIHTFSGYLVISCYREWPQLNITSLVLSIKICIKKEINVTQIYKWHLFIWGLKQVQAMGQSVGDSCLLKRFFFFYFKKKNMQLRPVAHKTSGTYITVLCLPYRKTQITISDARYAWLPMCCQHVSFSPYVFKLTFPYRGRGRHDKN